MIEGDADLFQIGREGGKVLGHVPVDIDDRAREAIMDLG
jgi:hypothetical protein